MTVAQMKYCALFSLWAISLAGTLSIARWPGDWGQAMCGVWGCGPPLQALVACHVSWMVVLIPPTLYLLLLASRRESFAEPLFRGASVTLVIAILIAGCFTVHEYLTWYVTVSEFQKPYFWHRVGLVVVTTVEAPLLEVTSLATIVLIWLHSSHSPVHKHVLNERVDRAVAGVGDNDGRSL